MNLELRKYFSNTFRTEGTWEIWCELEDGSWDLHGDNVWSFCDEESRDSQYVLAKTELETLEG